MLIGVNPQDSWLGDTSPHTGVLSLQEVQPEPEDASVPREGPQIPQGWFSPPHTQGKPQGTKALLKKSLPQHGGRRGGQGMRVLPGQTTVAGPGGREHAGLEGDQEHLQCPLSSHHSPVQPAPSTFWEGLPPGHLDHFWSMSLCPHPKANSKKGIFVKTCELVSGL